METTEKKETRLEIVEKVPKEMLQSSLKIYSESTAMETYVKIPFLLFGVFILIHNVFIAGKSYDYQAYENIKTIEISIVVILVISVIIMAIIAMSKNSKVKNELKEISKRYGIKKEVVQEEFSTLAIHLYGGRGIVLK
ncbi:hypothetical protein [uncultured Tenacibaculum sp.]|uniref:hypothetical protein n=1 Tax=uncultured Tenacibaculum sp. TaxID=174713 RepID=UPI0026022064|nr:hypothetical protein [uncultured Tenacibaculum sp.]